MDLTDKNIKMCEMADEIQEIFLHKLYDPGMQWIHDYISVIFKIENTGGLTGCCLEREPMYAGLTWKNSNWVIYNGEIREGAIRYHYTKLLKNVDPDARVIWIPRQDQYQEMIWNPIQYDYSWRSVIFAFNLFCEQEFYPRSPDDSIDQLWLEFVMYTKYGKIWNDKKENWELSWLPPHIFRSFCHAKGKS